MVMHLCKIWEPAREISKSEPCLYKIRQIKKIEKTCLECDYYKDVLFPPKVSKKKPRKPKSKKLKPRIEALKKWEHHFRDPLIFIKSFWKGDYNKIAKIMRVKSPDERFRNELSFIIDSSFHLNVYEVRQVMPMPRKRPGREWERRFLNLPNRKILNRPFYFLMALLALFYEKWTNKRVTRENKNFKELVNYCISSMGLSKVYPPEAMDRGVQTIIHKSMKDFRNKWRDTLRKDPSLSLRDLDLIDVIPTDFRFPSLLPI